MNKYAIITDSAADLDQALVEQLDIEVVPLSLTLGGKSYKDWPDRRELDPKELYARLRAGETATTAAINVSDAREVMEPHLKAGEDVLFLAFSSGLSSTCQSAQLAAQELAEAYPARKCYVVDTLCASLGQGLLVYLTAKQRQAGADIDAARDYAEENKLHLCHWFTVDDLQFLKRGGRISSTTAMLGTMLSIKPVLHVDNAGHLISISKARGRQASIKAMVDRAAQSAIEPEGQTMFICHGDCMEDAEYLAGLARERLGVQDIHIGYTGPVIGSHSGPGTLALFFLGEQR